MPCEKEFKENLLYTPIMFLYSKGSDRISAIMDIYGTPKA